MSRKSIQLKQINAGHDGQQSDTGAGPVPDYGAMGWRELQSAASHAGVLKRGMDRGQILAALGADSDA